MKAKYGFILLMCVFATMFIVWFLKKSRTHMDTYIRVIKLVSILLGFNILTIGLFLFFAYPFYILTYDMIIISFFAILFWNIIIIVVYFGELKIGDAHRLCEETDNE